MTNYNRGQSRRNEWRLQW